MANPPLTCLVHGHDFIDLAVLEQEMKEGVYSGRNMPDFPTCASCKRRIKYDAGRREFVLVKPFKKYK